MTFMASPNEPAERLNRTVAHVEDNILPWLKGRLRRAQQDERYGSPDDARQEKSSIKIVAEFYQDKLKTLADEVAANGISLPADQGRFGKVNQKLDKIVDQTENVRPRIDGPKVARGPEWSSGRSIS
jgi:hypothetical protein